MTKAWNREKLMSKTIKAINTERLEWRTEIPSLPTSGARQKECDLHNVEKKKMKQIERSIKNELLSGGKSDPGRCIISQHSEPFFKWQHTKQRQERGII